MKPVLFSAALLGVFLGWFSNSVLPEANFKARSLFLDIRMKKPGFDLESNIFLRWHRGVIRFWRVTYPNNPTSMLSVTIYQEATATRDQAVITAELGILSSDERSYSLVLRPVQRLGGTSCAT